MHRTLSLGLASSLVLSIAFAAGCSSSAPVNDKSAASPSADQISNSDDPTILLPNASLVLADVITSGDVGQTFGTDDAHVPYPDTYWPFVDNGCDAKWNGDSTQSPLEKLMALTDAADVQAAKDWERTNHGKDVPNVASWFGHCPGWTGAAMMNAPLQHAINVKLDGGSVVSCDASDATCTKFEIADVNALMAEVYVDADSRFIGNRCDTKPSDIQRDANGRIVRNGSGCQGLNAGALMVVLGYQMKQQHLAMAIDAQNDFNTDQIWNQPAYRYKVYGFQPLAVGDAVAKVMGASLDGGAAPTTYPWNDQAKGFALVDVGIEWVHENGPNTVPVSGADNTNEMRFVAVLELDKDASDATAKILGGEYVDDGSSGADRLTVPPFVWIATGIGPDAPSGDGNGHNPFVKPAIVKQLVALAQQ